jgi:hypothetical protein
MRSNFHKRGAMGTLRRELARQKMADTAVRDCFPTATMDKVKSYIRFAMRMKAAGTIDKFQIINRRGQPILQTGKRAGVYADYQGNIEDNDQDRQADKEADDGPWTTVGRKGKKIPANASTQQSTSNGQAAVDGATALPSSWVRMIEEDYPELPAAKKGPSMPQRQTQQATPRDGQRQQQINDINSKLQQLSTAPATGNSAGVQRPQEPRNKPGSRNNSRGSSKNNSRRTSRERVAGGHPNNNNQGSRDSSSPPPFKSYFNSRVYNSSEETGTIPKYRNNGSQQQLHEQHHRKR